MDLLKPATLNVNNYAFLYLYLTSFSNIINSSEHISANPDLPVDIAADAVIKVTQAKVKAW